MKYFNYILSYDDEYCYKKCFISLIFFPIYKAEVHLSLYHTFDYLGTVWVQANFYFIFFNFPYSKTMSCGVGQLRFLMQTKIEIGNPKIIFSFSHMVL